MAQRMITTWVLLALAIIGTLLFRRYGQSTYRRFKQRYPRHLTKWVPLKNWVRIIWGSYQILTKVPSTYQLSLPPTVADLIATVLPALDLGLGGIAAVPLQCLGFRGYLPQLIFVMVLPPIAFAVLYPMVVNRSKKAPPKRSTRAAHVGRTAQQGLPLALIISFLAFPVVSSQACAVDLRTVLKLPR